MICLRSRRASWTSCRTRSISSGVRFLFFLPIILLEKELQKSLDSFKGSVEFHQPQHDRPDVLRIHGLHESIVPVGVLARKWPNGSVSAAFSSWERENPIRRRCGKRASTT